MLVWGGVNRILSVDPRCCTIYLDSGSAYHPAADRWTPIRRHGAPEARMGHTAVWTGSLMILWGGWNTPYGFYAPLNSGGRYAPGADLWTPTSTTMDVPPVRSEEPSETGSSAAPTRGDAR